MNKIVDKKEVKGNKNEMCSRHKLKCVTSIHSNFTIISQRNSSTFGDALFSVAES